LFPNKVSKAPPETGALGVLTTRTVGESNDRADSQVPTTPPIVRGRVAGDAPWSEAYKPEGTVWMKELVYTVPKFLP